MGNITTAIASGKSSTISNGKLYSIYGSMGEIGKSDDYDYSGERILIARVGANAGSMYRASGNYKVSDNTLMVDFNTGFNAEFIHCAIYRSNLKRLVFGSGQPLVTSGHLKGLKIALPSQKEQQKIAAFLSAIDEKITLTREQLNKTKEFKKGLLQRMFV